MNNIDVAVSPDVANEVEANWFNKPEATTEEIRDVYDKVLHLIIAIRKYIMQDGNAVDRLNVDPRMVAEIRKAVANIRAELVFMCATEALAERLAVAFDVSSPGGYIRMRYSDREGGEYPFLPSRHRGAHEMVSESLRLKVVISEDSEESVRVEENELLRNSLVEAIKRVCMRIEHSPDWASTLDPQQAESILYAATHTDEDITIIFKNALVAERFIYWVGARYFHNVVVCVS